MADTIYRCGWCGTPTYEDGTPIDGDTCEWDKYLAEHEHCEVGLVNGACCPAGDMSEKDIVSRQMMIDAGMI